MEKLFLEAKKLSNSEIKNEKDLLEMHINITMELIIKSHENIIKYYASRYFGCAPLFICTSKNLYNKTINMKKLLDPDDYLLKKHEEHQIEPLLKRIKKFFSPFKVDIIKGNDIIKLFENVFKHKINNINIENDIICVIVSWNE